jgi:hypothetical protein
LVLFFHLKEKYILNLLAIWKENVMAEKTERDQKLRALDLAVSQIEKQFGKGSIMRLGSNEAVPDVAVIPTGSLKRVGVKRFTSLSLPAKPPCTERNRRMPEAERHVSFIDAEHALTSARESWVSVPMTCSSAPDPTNRP